MSFPLVEKHVKYLTSSATILSGGKLSYAPSVLSTLYHYLAQRPLSITVWLTFHCLPASIALQSHLTTTVATTDHCHMQLPILDQSVPMTSLSCDSHRQVHLPLSILIASS